MRGEVSVDRPQAGLGMGLRSGCDELEGLMGGDRPRG
jgi:hypothetical protein